MSHKVGQTPFSAKASSDGQSNSNNKKINKVSPEKGASHFSFSSISSLNSSNGAGILNGRPNSAAKPFLQQIDEESSSEAAESEKSPKVSADSVSSFSAAPGEMESPCSKSSNVATAQTDLRVHTNTDGEDPLASSSSKTPKGSNFSLPGGLESPTRYRASTYPRDTDKSTSSNNIVGAGSLNSHGSNEISSLSSSSASNSLLNPDTRSRATSLPPRRGSLIIVPTHSNPRPNLLPPHAHEGRLQDFANIGRTFIQSSANRPGPSHGEKNNEDSSGNPPTT